MSQDPESPTLEERVAHLERVVDELRRAQSTRAAGPHGQGTQRTRPPAPRLEVPRRPPREPVDWSARAEGMLGKVGVGFVLLALAFLFKYSFDQGWVTPAARVALGVVGGLAMLVVGLRLEQTRRTFAAILLGGAVSILYVSGFAASQLYALVPWTLAFPYMVTVTLIALVLAERQAYPSLASLGAAGGLSTPFLVDAPESSVAGLVTYTLLIILGSGFIQFTRGWRSLLATLTVGGLTVLGLAADRSGGSVRWLTLGGLLVLWVVVAVLPVVRSWLSAMDSERWPVPSLRGDSSQRVALLDGLILRVVAVGVTLVTLLILGELWGWGTEWSGRLLIAVGAAAYVVLAWRVRASPPARDAAADAAAVLCVIGLWMAAPAEWVPLLQAGEAALLLLAAREFGMRGLGVIGHALFAFGALWLFGVTVDPPASRDLGDWLATMGQLGAIGLAFTSSLVLQERGTRTVYQLGVHVAMLFWLFGLFTPFANGQALVTVGWGVYGMALLIASFVRHHRGLQMTGLATLGLVAAKLLLVDMAQLDVIWRILLFFGFGGAFLVLSYFINRRDGEG